jgi:hypothetical protein
MNQLKRGSNQHPWGWQDGTKKYSVADDVAEFDGMFSERPNQAVII